MIAKQKKVIAVLFTGHVGSSWLTSLLADHPHIQQLGFEPVDELTELGIKATPYFEKLLQGEKPSDLPAEVAKIFGKNFESAEGPVSAAWDDPKYLACRYLIFKARVNLDLQLDFFRDWLPRVDPFLILLRRRNKIKNAVSQFKRTQLKISHLDQFEQTVLKRQPVVVDPEYICKQALQFTQRELQCKRYFEAVTQRRNIHGVEVCYEDLLADSSRSAFCRSLFQMLGIEDTTLNSSYRKMTNDSLGEAVVNFAELKTALAGSAFAPSLSDDSFDIVADLAAGRLKLPAAKDDAMRRQMGNLFPEPVQDC